MRLLIFIIFIFLFGCKSEKSNPFLNCFTKEQQEFITELNNSYKQFIENNYNGSVNQFYIAIEEGKILDNDELIFQSNDKNLFLELYENDFFLINLEFEDLKTSYVYLDSRSEFKKCLAKIGNDDKFICDYLNLLEKIGNPTLLSTSRCLRLKSKNYSQSFKLIEYISSIELYYYVLVNKFET